MTIRADILAGLKTALEGITVANGYNNTVVTVAYDAPEYGTVPRSSLPYLGISTVRETYEYQPSHVGSDWELEIVAYLATSAKTAVAMNDAASDLATDIRRVLHANEQLGVSGVISTTLTDRLASETTEDMITQGIAASLFRVVVKFQEAYTAS